MSWISLSLSLHFLLIAFHFDVMFQCAITMYLISI